MAPIQLRWGLARRGGHAGPSAAGAASAAVVLGRGPEEIWRVVGESGGAYSTDPGAVGKVPLPDGQIFPQRSVQDSPLASRRRLQTVAMTAHSLEQGLAPGRIDLAPEPRDIDVDDIGERVFAVAPDLVEDTGAGEDPAGRTHQQLEDSELLGRELDGIAAAPYFEQLPIENEIGNLQDVGARREIVRAAHQRLDAGQQLVKIEGLGEVVVGAYLEYLDLVLQRIHGGQHEDRRIVALEPQALANVIAVHVGKHEIEHDDVELAGLGKVDPLAAGGGDGNPMIFRPESAVNEVGDARLVFDQEHGHAFASVSAG